MRDGRRDDRTGQLEWSLRLTSLEGQAALPWSLAARTWRKGLPVLMHLEHGSMLWNEPLVDDRPAAEALYCVSQQLRVR